MPSATSNSPLSLGLVKLLSRPEPNILQNTAVDKTAANFCLIQSNFTRKTCNFFSKRRRSTVLLSFTDKNLTVVEGSGILTSVFFEQRGQNEQQVCFWTWKDTKQKGAVLSAPLLLKLLVSGSDRWSNEEKADQKKTWSKISVPFSKAGRQQK